MFTGIIEEVGEVAAIDELPGGRRITVRAASMATDVRAGESIAVNGVCLTVLSEGVLQFDLSGETLERSTLGSLAIRDRVNLERALLPTTRLGGHIVQGHVDCRGMFRSAVSDGDFWTVTIGFPPEFGKYLIHKGSVAVDGISLTVARLSEDSFDIAVIPKTWELTNLSAIRPGDGVNLEADVIAKYVERLTASRMGLGSS